MELSLSVGLAQYLHDCDPASIIADAKNAGAAVVVFPEMHSNGYARFDSTDPIATERWLKGAHRPDGTFVEKFRDAARACRVYVVATFLEAAEPKPFNSALLIDPMGKTVLHHRKVHICDFDSPECACARGSEFRVAEIETGVGPVNVGVMICMDREYPDGA